jgi:hypothetical protein
MFAFRSFQPIGVLPLQESGEAEPSFILQQLEAMDPTEDDIDLKGAAATMFRAGEITVSYFPNNCWQTSASQLSFLDMGRSVHFLSRYDSAPGIPGHGTERN